MKRVHVNIQNDSNIQNDQNVILALIEVSDQIKHSIIDINKELDMTNPVNRLVTQVRVKNIFENCRSALDYMAYLIVKTYKIPIKDENIYFPICDSEKYFEERKLIKY